MKRPLKWAGVAALALVAATLALGTPTEASSPAAKNVATAPAAAAAATAPLGRAAVATARAHLAATPGEFGLSAADVDQLAVSSVVPSDHNGLTHVYLQQRVERIEVSNAILNVAVTADGKVLRVASSAVAGAAKLANGAKPAITDVAAARGAAAALGLSPTESFASSDTAEGTDQERDLGDGGISSSPISAKLVYQPTEDGALRLTWELVIDQLDGEHWWQIRIDARSGAELDKNDWVSEDSHNVYPLPVEAPSFASPVDTRTLVNNPATSASPFGWNDTNAVAGPESTLTLGNNVRAYTDTDANNVPDAGSSPDGGAGLAFDFPLDLTLAPSGYRPAAVSNLYFINNRIHDIVHRYGFDEASGNFQVNNYGHGGSGNDAVNAEAQDGNGVNNANFGTPPDGTPPRMQMYVWNAPTPDRDGDLDNGIIIHEYGHGISSRLTGGAAAPGCLGNDEAGGEGWSDFFAYMLTMPNGIEPAAGRGIGTYALNQPTSGPGIRTQKYSTDMSINTKTYDSIKTMPVPHGVGEVWAEMLWEVTYALIAKYGFDPDLVTGTLGNNKALQLVMDGLKLQPCEPGFVDARDAIIAADQVDYAGANECLLWKAFAKRGLGFSATQGSTSSATDGVQAFDQPPYCNGLRVVRTATPSPVAAGTELTYGFGLTNTRDAGSLNGVSVSGALGNHASYVAGSATCGGTYDGTTRTVTFPVGTIAFGATQSCQFRALINPAASAVSTFSDDFEPDLSAWTAAHGSGTANWTLSTTAAHSPTHAAFASDPGVVSDQYLATTAPVAVAAGDELSFWHQRGLEDGWDGGVVEVSTNGTTWTDIGAAAFLENGYNGQLGPGVGNALAGRKAFTGTSGYVRSVATLAAYAGQSVFLRFRLGSDENTGDAGWYVDDVAVGVNMSTTSQGSAAATGLATQSQRLTTPITAAPPPNVPVTPPATAPAAPVITKAEAVSSKKVKVAFTPGATGGSPITSYAVTCTGKKGAKTKTKTGTASPVTVKGLTPGKKYTCTVTATNAVGTGPASAPKKAKTRGGARRTAALPGRP